MEGGGVRDTVCKKGARKSPLLNGPRQKALDLAVRYVSERVMRWEVQKVKR
jgi:hypothetical protein